MKLMFFNHIAFWIHKILGTRPRMTGGRGDSMAVNCCFLLPLTRHNVPSSPARGEGYSEKLIGVNNGKEAG